MSNNAKFTVKNCYKIDGKVFLEVEKISDVDIKLYGIYDLGNRFNIRINNFDSENKNILEIQLIENYKRIQIGDILTQIDKKLILTLYIFIFILLIFLIMNLGYIKYQKFIITIEDLCTIPYYDLMKFSSSTNHFKIISIEDIMGNYYVSIEIELFNGRFFDRDMYEIHLKESKFIQLNDILNDINSFQIYFFEKNDAFFSNFFVEKQWKLFEYGYTNLCKFNISHVFSLEFIINNGKLIGPVIMYLNDKFYSEIKFDKIKDDIVYYELEQNGKIENIETTKEKFMIRVKDLGVFCYLDY